MKDDSVLFVGPYPPPVHGQSYAFKMAFDNYPSKKILLSQNLESKGFLLKIVLTFFYILRYHYIFFTKKVSVVYLTCSRSLFGCFKDVVLIKLAHWKGVKLINHIHAANFDKFLNSLPFFIQKIYLDAFKKVPIYICLLPEMKKEFCDFESNSKIESVANFYDPELDSISDVKINDSGNIVISYFSNIVYSKGIFDLIDAFNLLCKKYKNIQLNIAGSFASDPFMDKNEVKELFYQAIKKSPNVKYFGAVYGEAKLNFLSNSQIFVLPSFYTSEAFPISIIEAMRAGNAIVVTDHHYLSNIIGNTHGKVVEIHNLIQLSQAIEYYIQNPDLLRSTQISNMKYAMENFKLRKYCERINLLIDSNTF